LSNPVAQLFWGRVRIIHATSFFFFFKGSIYQKLIHKLKYEGRMDIAYQLGRLFGAELKATFFSEADYVIAVPLHPQRQRKRGYNQSEVIAMGISDILQIKLVKGNLIRNKSTSTQTRKNRFERFLNMDGSFELREPNSLYGKKLILVDDVVTTGSTLEACAQVLLDSGCSDLGILTLGVA
jgi:ComF family protein